MDTEPSTVEFQTIQYNLSRTKNQSVRPVMGEGLFEEAVLCDTYVLRSRLGLGGMGEVWKADELFDGKFLRTVVIKTILPELQNSPVEMERVEAMFMKIHSFQHQHICPLYALKNDPKVGIFVVMKYIEGWTLKEYYSQYMMTHETFPVSELTRLLLPVAQALDYSHARNVIHRDVKPQNILISENASDGVQLIDFGLVEQANVPVMEESAGENLLSTSGTLPYMSPEQFSNQLQGPESDQFSLAIVVYELLSGHRPFCGNTIEVLGFQILNRCIDFIPGLPFHVNVALRKALTKNPQERFASCEEFIHALENPSLVYLHLLQKATKNKWYLSALALSVLCLALIIPFFRHEKSPEPSSVPVAKIQTEPVVKIQPEPASSDTPIPDSSLQTHDTPAPVLTRTVNGIEYRFHWCPPGTFLMGSTLETKSSLPLHKVTLTEGFWIGETEVTLEMFRSFVRETGYQSIGVVPFRSRNKESFFWIHSPLSSWETPDFPQEKDQPVVCISPLDSLAFCQWLSAKLDIDCTLPTEAQWEYAARGGISEAKEPNWIPSSNVWCDATAKLQTHPVTSFPPSPWGLYGMFGNVGEFCSDAWMVPPVRLSGMTDPQGPNNTSWKVVRGGGWSKIISYCSPYWRHYLTLDHRGPDWGFRIVLPGSSKGASPDTIKPVRRAGDVLFRYVNGQPIYFRWCPPNGNEKGFWILDSEVTGRLFASVLGYNPSVFSTPEIPVTYITHDECLAFCEALGKRLGLKVSLPTGDQWKYAARSGVYGNAGTYYNTNNLAWYGANSGLYPHPVKTKAPNCWGIYDMFGNVQEWTATPIENTQSPMPLWTYRGGSAWNDTSQCTPFYSVEYPADSRSNAIGFRVIVEDENPPMFVAIPKAKCKIFFASWGNSLKEDEKDVTDIIRKKLNGMECAHLDSYHKTLSPEKNEAERILKVGVFFEKTDTRQVVIFKEGDELCLPDTPDPKASIHIEDQTIIVTTLDDTMDPFDGKVSLREALYAVPLKGTVRFSRKLSGGTIQLNGEPLVIPRGMTVDASRLSKGITIDAGKKSRLLYVGYGKNTTQMTIKNVHFRNGKAWRYPGIELREAVLILDHCTIRNCESVTNSPTIGNWQGKVTMIESEVE